LLLRAGFLAALAGQWDDARKHWLRVAEYDAQLRVAREERYYNSISRLEGSVGKRFFIGVSADNVGFPPRLKPALWWADFLFLIERFDEADSLYRRLHSVAMSRGDAVVAARVGLGRVFALGEKAHDLKSARVWLPRAIDVGEKMLERYPQSPSAPYVAFKIGHSCANYDEARAAYRRVYTLYPRSRHAEPARFYEIFKSYHTGDPNHLLALIADFRRVHPKSDYLTILDDIEKTIRQRMAPSPSSNT